MPAYSLPVAAFDFLPVLASAAGLAALARGIAARIARLAPIAGGAAVLIPLGGACKASWKLIQALGGPPLPWLENLLFIALAPGFVAMAWALHHAVEAWRAGATTTSRTRLLAWLTLPLGGAALAATAAPGSRFWLAWLLLVTTCATAALVVRAIMAAHWAGLRWPVLACLAYGFMATLALGGLSRLPPGEATAWLQEGINGSAQAALAAGFWRLSRRMREKTA